MDTAPTFSLQDLIASIAGHTADSVSQRVGESRQRQDDRARAAMGAIMAFQPRDAVEAILVSHCLMFHEMIVADVHHTLCDEEPMPTRRATRNGIVAMDKAFGNNLIRLKHHRSAVPQETQPAENRAETEIADRIRRHLAQAEARMTNVPASDLATAADPAPTTSATDAWPTVAQMAGLNRQARRALDRQTRKRAPGLRQARRHARP